MWTSVVVPVTLGMVVVVVVGSVLHLLPLSIPLSVVSPLSPKYSTLSMGVQAGWPEASLARANYSVFGQPQGK